MSLEDEFKNLTDAQSATPIRLMFDVQLIAEKGKATNLSQISLIPTFFFKFCPNVLNGGIDEDRALAKQRVSGISICHGV